MSIFLGVTAKILRSSKVGLQERL